jgi:hypothetical protein
MMLQNADQETRQLEGMDFMTKFRIVEVGRDVVFAAVFEKRGEGVCHVVVVFAFKKRAI